MAEGGGTRGGAFSASEFAGIGFQLAASILVFLFIGNWLDGRLGTSPVLLIAGVFVGAGGALYSMYRRLVAAQRRGRSPGDGGEQGEGRGRPRP